MGELWQGLHYKLQEWCGYEGGTPEGCNALRQPGSLFCGAHKEEGEKHLAAEVQGAEERRLAAGGCSAVGCPNPMGATPDGLCDPCNRRLAAEPR